MMTVTFGMQAAVGDNLTAKFMLPLGGLLTVVFIGWFANQSDVRDEFTNHGTVASRLFPVYQLVVRFIVPLLIVLVFLHQFGLL